MNGSHLELDEAQSLTGTELNALQDRLAPGTVFDGATTIRDVAEAAGLPEVDVAAHLRRIRAETAFTEPPRARPSALPWIAGATLVVGLGVTWWRIHPNDPSSALQSAPPVLPSATRTTVRPSVQTTPLTAHWEGGPGSEHPPTGFRVEAIGEKSDEVADNSGEARALPYETVRDGLARAAEAVVGRAASEDGMASAPPGTHYRGQDGSVFSPRPGFVHLALSGWAGSTIGWIAVPLTGASRTDLKKLAEKLLEDAKRTQDQALAPVADPSSGLVAPPPAFSLRFAGRRLEVLHGPRVSFAPIAPSAIVARLEAAIVNATFRDRRPPLGPWTGDAAADARIPLPETSHVEIMGPEGVTVGDVPTVPGEVAATARAAHDLAVRATRGFDEVNRRALETDGTLRP